MNLKIIFDGNGATSGRMNDQDISVAASLRGNSFKKTGFVFGGWSTTKNGNKAYDDKQIYPYSSDLAGKNVVLYAVWIKIVE